MRDRMTEARRSTVDKANAQRALALGSQTVENRGYIGNLSDRAAHWANTVSR
jgi:hypothetical protein